MKRPNPKLIQQLLDQLKTLQIADFLLINFLQLIPSGQLILFHPHVVIHLSPRPIKSLSVIIHQRLPHEIIRLFGVDVIVYSS